MLEQRRLHRQAVMVRPIVGTFAEPLQDNVEGGAGLLQADLVEDLPCCLLCDGIGERADAVLLMVHDPRVVRVLLPKLVGDGDSPEVLLLRNGMVVPGNASLGYNLIIVGGETHTAVAHPEKAPVVTVRRGLWFYCRWETD